MQELLKNGYHARKRPSGHDISKKFAINNGAAIPPNLIALANTESNSFYLRYCRDRGIEPHPARYPAELPEYFIRMLTDPGDFVIDPFAGSCVTGEVCERVKRHWVCIEQSEDYLRGAFGRFMSRKETAADVSSKEDYTDYYYKLARPGILWNGIDDAPLPYDGGKKRSVGQYLTQRAEDIAVDEAALPIDNYQLQSPATLWKGVEEARDALKEQDRPECTILPEE